MGRDFYREGYEAGHAAAQVAAKALRSAKDAEAAAKLCGEKLEEVKRVSDKWEARYSKSWPLGFFDGWMDYAERVRSRPRN